MRSLILLPASLLSAAALAQTQDIYITNANVTAGIEFNSTATVAPGPTYDFFIADPAGDPAGVLFKTAWAYRLDNDTREYIFNDVGATFVNSGPTGMGTWTDVDARGKISAVVTYTAVPTSATSGAVVGRMTVTNISSAPVSLTMFHLADIDLCGAAWTTNMATPGSNGRQSYTGSCSETAEHYAAGADRWEIGSYTNSPAGNIDLYTQLEDNTLYDLRNDTAVAGPFDLRGAYEWQNHMLAPNQSETFTIALSHNVGGCAYGFNRFAPGLAGGTGVPTLSATADAVIGSSFTPTIGNAPSGALAILALGFARATTTIGDINLYVASPVNMVAVVGSGNTATFPLTVPNNPALCGLQLVAEGFIIGDTTSTSTTTLPVTHTPGVVWTLGMY